MAGRGARVQRRAFRVFGAAMIGTLSALGAIVAGCSYETSAADPEADGGMGKRAQASGEADGGSGDAHRVSLHPGAEPIERMRTLVVYIGEEGKDGAPSVTDFTDWLFDSAYWARLTEYGVQKGEMLPQVRIPTESLFSPSMLDRGELGWEELDAAIRRLLHPESEEDAGADGAPDAGDVAGASTHLVIPAADGYVFMLPVGVQVTFGRRGTRLFRTCVDTGGYHAHDGLEPYAIIPGCRYGWSALALSHEIAEMATAPRPGEGWFSDADVENAGGEIADICNREVGSTVEGWAVTQLWSNREGRCAPE